MNESAIVTPAITTAPTEEIKHITLQNQLNIISSLHDATAADNTTVGVKPVVKHSWFVRGLIHIKNFFAIIGRYIGRMLSDDPMVSSSRIIMCAAAVAAIWLMIYKTLHGGLSPHDGTTVIGLTSAGSLPKIGASIADAIKSKIT